MKIFATILFFILYASSAFAETSATLNGSMINSNGKSSSIIAGSIDYEKEGKKWKQNFGSEVLYQNSGKFPVYNVEITGKLGRNIDAKNYIKADFRFEYDNTKKNTMAITSVIGHGYRFIRNDKMRLSNELGIGVYGDQLKNIPIVSDSIWFSWKITPNVSIGNKLLIEKSISNSDENYITNTSTIGYSLNSRASIHMENRIYKENSIDSNTTLLGLTVQF